MSFRDIYKNIWTEDDAFPPDGEKLYQAWGRIFKEQYSPSSAIEVEDDGDSIVKFFVEGRVAVITPTGDEIWIRNI